MQFGLIGFRWGDISPGDIFAQPSQVFASLREFAWRFGSTSLALRAPPRGVLQESPQASRASPRSSRRPSRASPRSLSRSARRPSRASPQVSLQESSGHRQSGRSRKGRVRLTLRMGCFRVSCLHPPWNRLHISILSSLISRNDETKAMYDQSVTSRLDQIETHSNNISF